MIFYEKFEGMDRDTAEAELRERDERVADARRRAHRRAARLFAHMWDQWHAEDDGAGAPFQFEGK